MKGQSSFDFFSTIKSAGVLLTGFQARVFLTEERQLLTNGLPYFRLVLCPAIENDTAPLSDDDGRQKMCAIAIGSPIYESAKSHYKEGQIYSFHPGTFRTRARKMDHRSWSTMDYDLFFLPDAKVMETPAMRGSARNELQLRCRYVARFASSSNRINQFWSKQPWKTHPLEKDCESWRSNDGNAATVAPFTRSPTVRANGKGTLS